MIIGVGTFLEDFKEDSIIVKILRDSGESEETINKTLCEFFDNCSKLLKEPHKSNASKKLSLITKYILNEDWDGCDQVNTTGLNRDVCRLFKNNMKKYVVAMDTYNCEPRFFVQGSFVKKTEITEIDFKIIKNYVKAMS